MTTSVPRLRPLLQVAFARAQAFGLTIDALEAAFKPRADSKARVARSELRLQVPHPPESIGAEPVPGERRRVRAR
jgi:hypothetical protein